MPLLVQRYNRFGGHERVVIARALLERELVYP